MNSNGNDWVVKLIDTGLNTQTGGRVKQIEPYIDTDSFCLTYGDGLSNVDLDELLDFHNAHGKIASLTAIQPEGKFGALNIKGTQIDSFLEKPKGDGQWINGGFFVFNKQLFNYLNNDMQLILERAPLENLANDGELQSFQHRGFWKCMDTLRDKNELNDLAISKCPPWQEFSSLAKK